MLKFNVWPPAKDGVVFTEEFRKAYKPELAGVLGMMAGSIIAKNLPSERQDEAPDIIASLISSPNCPDDIYEYGYDADDEFDKHPFEDAALRGAGTTVYDAAMMKRNSSAAAL